jgi:ATP-dependent Clp protease ATP-binding subunit ClpA
MAPAPPLADLIATVEADAASAEPLACLATASATAAELADTSDALVGHFVDRCRAAGHTWADISDALGVTRQAAHKRYSVTPRELNRWTERAKAVLAASVDAARGLGQPYVGTEHLLLGLFPPGGIGAAVLAEQGITEASVAEHVVARTPVGPAGPAEPPFTPLAAQVFGGALSEALSMGHNYIGTEHLLLALFGQPEGQAAQILADAGATHAACKARIAEMLVGLTT